MNPAASHLLAVSDLRTSFAGADGAPVRAVDGVSFHLEKGETLGIVGESGSGKSVTCYSLLRLVSGSATTEGKALFQETDLLSCSRREMARIRGKRISMIFQDPMTSLNPYLRVEEQLIEPLLIHENIGRRAARERAIRALDDAGIQDAPRRIRSYPHEFSGGMRQRVMIAMALITKPEILIADEPTTALDVTVQAQILELIKKMQDELGMAVLFVTHDLGIVSGFCDRVLVMYAGRVVETASTADIFYDTKHPYAKALQKAAPALQPKGAELYTIRGAPPDPSKRVRGCPFAPRCDYAVDYCTTDPIHLEETAPAHSTACLRVQREGLKL